jgi:hypothetical protein
VSTRNHRDEVGDEGTIRVPLVRSKQLFELLRIALAVAGTAWAAVTLTQRAEARAAVEHAIEQRQLVTKRDLENALALNSALLQVRFAETMETKLEKLEARLERLDNKLDRALAVR